MANLPITTSTPQTAAVSKPAANSSADANGTANSPPFGEVLARQIKDPTAKDAPAKDTKVEDKLAADALAQVLANANDSSQPAGASDANATAALPSDILAAMMPQALGTASTASTAANFASGKSSGEDVTTRAISSLKKNVAGSVQTGVQSDFTAKAATGENIGAQAQLQEQTFAGALSESAKRPAGSGRAELASTTAEALSAPAAAQPNAAALTSLQNTAASLAAPVQQTAQVTINTPVTQDKWGDEFSQKITWLASSSQDQSAELHLNPPDLGPLDVVLKVSGDQATALFTSQHAAVRDAIEQALPKLRDMLADNGIMLGNATVSDQTPRDQGQSGSQRTATPSGNDNSPDPAVASVSTARVSPIQRHNGMVDTFA